MARESNDIVLSYYDCLVRKEDIKLLTGPHWLNDVLIGFYFEYLDHKVNKDGKKKLLFISPELTQLLKMTDPLQYNIFLEPMGMSNASFAFFPLNNCNKKDAVGGSHWSLLVYCQNEGTCYHFDSANGCNGSIAQEFAKNLSSQISDKPGSKFIEPKCPQQDNGYDCGIYVLCLTDVILQYISKTSNLNDCDYDQVKKLIRTKRAEILDLIKDLKNASDTYN